MIDLAKMTDRDAERFDAKCLTPDRPDWIDRCWRWAGLHRDKTRGGYPRFWFQGHNVGAHRVAYYLTFGEMPAHLEIDHTCRNTGCVNPHHLEAVDPDANRQRRIDHHRKQATR